MSARYEAAKQATETQTAGTIEGALLDTFTASALVAVYEAMSPENQARFDSIPLDKLVAFCFQQAGMRA